MNDLISGLLIGMTLSPALVSVGVWIGIAFHKRVAASGVSVPVVNQPDISKTASGPVKPPPPSERNPERKMEKDRMGELLS